MLEYFARLTDDELQRLYVKSKDQFDAYYEYSEDPYVYDMGTRARDRINQIRAELTNRGINYATIIEANYRV